ncbi:alpha/beta hydrolase [Frankia sp. CcI156]|uniref:Alpha/beta hydrolase fold-3 n=1 Tax=Frankia casuarinae (strain DSM 45818 / CECT 9043 / HFP020203 / CcI3) TaxID=106370 RepID=Q2J9C3_FRACC|nr:MULTISPECIES: alpha/beta hydrolase [Frankia]ABD12119.1 Alpha/beta hydrolase fold-3 [Frankia casuarinae]ETA00522.1 esterase/lipase [Frankia sp. CcI6]EYT91837.1 esterase/lipase [Frankia casuarinae]KDA41007.1 esterase/lipase [Frankia sp. BMG5.23]KFB03239.1 esterase/lipase [Frankia sp. Allo2]
MLALGLGLAACSRHGSTPRPSSPTASGPGGPNSTLAQAGTPEESDGLWVLRDVPYAPVSPAQRLDLYRPSPPAPTAGAEGARVVPGTVLPVVLTIHGGAFMLGDKRDDLPVVRALVHAGYAVASLNYRLSGEAKFPAAVQDVKASVRWLRAHAGTYGLDPSRIAATGASAGAYLAVMLGTTSGVAMFDDPDLGNPGVSSDVQAVVDFYGPVNFASMDAQLRTNERCTVADAQHDRPHSPESRFLGRTVTAVPQLVRVASPLNYLSRGPLPPFLIEHGDADCTVPHQQSLELAHALRTAGAPAVDVTIVPGAGHGGAFPTRERMGVVLAFLHRTIGR